MSSSYPYAHAPTVRLTVGQALVRFLTQQYSERTAMSGV